MVITKSLELDLSIARRYQLALKNGSCNELGSPLLQELVVQYRGVLSLRMHIDERAEKHGAGCFFHQFRVVCSNLSVDKKMNSNNGAIAFIIRWPCFVSSMFSTNNFLVSPREDWQPIFGLQKR